VAVPTDVPLAETRTAGQDRGFDRRESTEPAADPRADVPLPRRAAKPPAVPSPVPEQRATTGMGLLPRRTRQASLVPQLCEPDPPTVQKGTSDLDPTDPARTGSPDEIRARLSAFQDGVSRGRQEPITPDDGRDAR
jgi:hypothetical protein